MNENKDFNDEDLILFAYFLGCAKIIKILIKLFKNGGFDNEI